MHNNKLKRLMLASTTAALLGAGVNASAFSLSTDTVDASLYGYLRLNASYDFDQNIASPARTGQFSGLGPAGEDVKGHFGASAHQSRIGLRVNTQTGMKFNIEGDFRGANGTFRVRHAYGEYKGFLAGQTWTNFLSFRGFTPSLDVDSHPGVAGFIGRVGQVRYTTGGFSIAAEENRAAVVGSSDVRRGLPTFTARFEESLGGLNYALGGLLQEVTVDDGSIDESELGYIMFVGASWPVTSKLTLHAAANYSDGANMYLYRSGENFGGEDGYFDGTGITTIKGYSGTLGASFDVATDRKINLAYGMTELDWDDALDDLGAATIGGKSERNEKAMINYQWFPVSNVMVGVEFAHLRRENVDGNSYDANRLMFAAQFSF